MHFFVFLFLSITSRSDCRSTLCRNATVWLASARRQKCLSVVESRRLFPIEGLLWAKKSAFLLSFSATVKPSRGNRYCATVIIRPCGPSPPVLGSITKVWLAAASGVERLATLAWRLRKEFSSFLRREKGKKGDKQAKKKQLGFTSTDNRTVRYQYWYITSRVPNLSIDTRYCQYRASVSIPWVVYS